jgi:protein O-mannosyl-transferase
MTQGQERPEARSRFRVLRRERRNTRHSKSDKLPARVNRKKPKAEPARPSAGPSRAAIGPAFAFLGTLGVVALVFSRVASYGFLNWDDPDVLVRNPPLDGPGVVAWAFSTTHVGHYQPLAWLAWAALRRGFGSGAAVHHLAALVGHAVNTALVFLLARRLAGAARLSAGAGIAGALLAALAFGLHPLRVEVVAWASAFPYALALGPLLLACLAYCRYVHTAAQGWFAAALALYGVSLLCRPMAPGFALVLLILDLWLRRSGTWGSFVFEKLPFGVLGALAALAEAGARSFAPLERVGLVSRLGHVAWAPLVYVARTLWPSGLTPLDPLPIESRGSAAEALAGVGLLVVVTLVAWRLRDRSAAIPAGWFALLVLAAPAAGFVPSGLQASADRYTYLPGVVLALLAGGAFARGWERPARRPLLAAIGLLVSGSLALATTRYLPAWRDSIALWTRALEADPRNDVALYNLALALEEKGDNDAAIERYEELLRVLPEHGPARHNRERLLAQRFEREAGALAQAGRLTEAVATYSRALALDPLRLHSRRSRGMALAELGRCEEALADLQSALAAGSEPAVLAALDYCQRQSRPVPP